ncbi:MAG: DUF4272 domain-containing protein [Archangium sp.]
MATTKKPLFDPDEATATEGMPVREPVTAAEVPVTEDDDFDDADDSAPISAPPEADVVAGRALMVAALIERARLESSRDAKRAAALSEWVDAHGLFGNLGPEGVDLFDRAPGEWSDDDLDAVDWTAEELRVLLWAINKTDLGPASTRADVNALLGSLPVLEPADEFIDNAVLRDAEEIDVQRALAEALLEAVRSEAWARTITEDPQGFESDADLEELLESIEADGFDRKAAAEQGAVHEAVSGLRFWSRSLLRELFASGSPHEHQKLDSSDLVSWDDATLGTLLGVVHARVEALEWLQEGDEYESDDGEEGEEDDQLV